MFSKRLVARFAKREVYLPKSLVLGHQSILYKCDMWDNIAAFCLAAVASRPPAIM